MEPSKYHHGNLKEALIKAGIKILALEGIGGLSLRKVAKQAGVSHTAPYAHFSDKQALVAAISTEGYTRIYNKIAELIEHRSDAPLDLLVMAAYAYMRFGLDEPDLFRITFSGVIEHEREYPDLVEITQKNFRAICQIVSLCQDAEVLNAGDEELLALNLWGTVHGLISLLLQGQVSSKILDRNTHEHLLITALDQITKVKINVTDFPSILA